MNPQISIQTYFTRTIPQVPFKSAQAVLEMAKEGATIPFMARYRKEKTGNLDEVQIKLVVDSFEKYQEVIKRQEFLVSEIEKQGQLTDDLKKRILNTIDLNELDEIYRPFKKKKKTKATLAREAGLGPLADWLWGLGHGEVQDSTALEIKGKEYLNVEKGYVTYELALKGAQDIISERIYNDLELRALVRKEFFNNGVLVSKKTKNIKPHSKFEMYFDFKEKITSLKLPKASHRYLAMRRGWHDGELTLTIEGDFATIEKKFYEYATPVRGHQAVDFLENCAKVALYQHVVPSISNEVHSALKEEADRHAVNVFSENVRRLLLASPFGPKWVLGVDPGLKTGCKVALVDNSGKFITHTVFDILGEGAETRAQDLLKELVNKIDAIGVGNGTGGREAFAIFRKALQAMGSNIPVIMVNESGASVYSASEVAREEFPDLDLTVKGAISIARRLQDPLSELVKIDPKSIGVGQYQHDVSQTLLKKSLDFVVESCVNQVGVDLNTASEYLLRYISGIGPAVAKNVVEYRNTNGLFKERGALLKIPHFSSKTFEQAAGFLRIQDGTNPLDKTGIHPERYSVVRDIAQDLGVNLSALMGEGAKKILEHRQKWIELVGEYTFDDIVKELEKPGRDPRDPFKAFAFRDDIQTISDVKTDMVCPGIVTNVTNFGAFVDIGVHQDGLVHISELAHKFVDDPQAVVHPGDIVTVKVIGVNVEKNQISLSMKLEAKPEASEARRDFRTRQPRDSRKEGEQANFKGEKRFKNQKNASDPQQGGKAKFNPKGRDNRPNQGAKRPRQAPLNNPFGVLAGLKDQLKK